MDQLTPRQILDRLVGFPTVSSDSNLALVDWLQDYLQNHGIECHRHWNDDGTKAALMAHAGPRIPGAVVLSGHSDVVPVTGQTWATDPWVVTERDGRLYGRGTCDMKGFVALAVWALVRAQVQGCRRPLQLALSYDEEVGCTGAPPMIAAMQRVLPKGEVALIGEPSRMAVINGHKTGTGFHVHVKGYEVHSSLLPDGVSAIMEAARLIGWVNDRNAALMANAGPSPFYPPFTTLHVGMIHGGTAHNITAGDCHFAIEMRVLPGEDAEALADDLLGAAARLDAALKARRPEAGVTLTRFFGVPGLRPEPAGAAEALAARLTGANGTGVVSYGTEAGQFQQAGYSAVICGPGDIAQAHQADEYLDLSEFLAGQAFMERLLQALQ
ncbi:MAG: acetylornithine deacetylase [Alphaproteobacteria bacterium]